MTWYRRSARLTRSAEPIASGVHSATVASSGNRKPSGMTPTISNGSPSRMSVRPTAFGSAPMRPTQKP